MRNGYVLPPVVKMPPVLRELMSNAHHSMHYAVLFGAIEPLMTLCTRVRGRYFRDAKPHMMLCQVVIVGAPSRGKSLIGEIESLIMKRLREHDRMLYRAEEDYKALKKRSSKSKDLPPAPKLTVRYLEPTLTKLQLIKRCDRNEIAFGEPVTTHAFSEELGVMVDSMRSRYSNLSTILRFAYDGAMAGNDAASEESYSGMAHICHNMLMLSTPDVLMKFMNRSAIGAGSCTRLIVCTMPGDTEFDADLPPMRPLTDAQKALVDDIVNRLMNETYVGDSTLAPVVDVDMEFLFETERRWLDETMSDAINYGSQAYAMFRKRSSVSAFRVATTCKHLYELEARYETKTINNLCKRIYLAVATRILDEMYAYFGAIYESIVAEGSELQHRCVNIIDELPEVFTREDLADTVARLKVSTPCRVLLHNWITRKNVESISEGRFRKLVLVSKHRRRKHSEASAHDKE